MRETVWITGGHGFIGRHMAMTLSREGANVYGIGHRGSAEPGGMPYGLKGWLDGDVATSNLALLCNRSGPPTRIYHLAGGSSVGAAIAAPHEDFRRTVDSTAEVLAWLHRHSPQTTLVVASSAAVYGAGHDGAIGETAPLSPFSPYGHHKAMMESLCRSYGTSYGTSSVIVRLFSVYGSGLHKQLLWDLCSRLRADPGSPELGGTGDELRDWTDVRDVVRALVFCADRAAPDAPAINAGSGIATSVRDVAATVAAAWASGGKRRAVRFSGRSRPGDPFSLVADATLLRDVGFEWHVPLEQGIADYVHWFRQQGEGSH